ncbi:sensor histidine kinase [Janthinobacterium lividum]|uniref:sensor histidine kinase n=1 Tax=Janthinobacterium lividum TaxID=29581 RepID=UPI001595B72C|nr:ATP-binding protein [Janthinobacterium lividum]QKY07506.1 signaling protein [Janthinobacterium lividum]
MAKTASSIKATEEEQPYVQFTIESRVLRELGERLVSDAEVALTELIKNAFDADAFECTIALSGDQLVIQDNGNGMSFEDFRTKWMRIATGNKEQNPISARYKRKLTGSKGVGRFAVRFLGKRLILESVAMNAGGQLEKLTAGFDWAILDQNIDILDLKVPYKLEPTDQATGTTLTIQELRVSIEQRTLYNVKSGVLGIASPVYAFLNDAPEHVQERFSLDNSADPGFNVLFENDIRDEDDAMPLAAIVLANSVASTRINFSNNEFEVIVNHSKRGEVLRQIYTMENQIGSDVYIDVRYFPKRPGVFQRNDDFRAPAAWDWVRANNGVKVYDHGFHIKPYGTKDDDWLQLDHDTAYNRRRWRSWLTEQFFPMDAVDAAEAKRNPMVSLPTNYQTVGAIFLESLSIKNAGDDALSPSMDRQGFIANAGFSQLQSLTRFAVELVAHFDKKIQLEDEEKARNALYAQRTIEIDSAIKEIQNSATLNKEDKDRIVSHYSRVKSDIKNLEEYDRNAREGLETMSLLGVVAGFMTHEFQAALMHLETAASKIRTLAIKDPSLNTEVESIDNSIKYFTGYIDYTKLFVSSLHLTDVKPYKVLPTVMYVVSTFNKFQIERSVEVDTSEIDKNLVAPLIPAAMYQGIIHNLYTNALKILLSSSQDNKVIAIQSWNEKGRNILQVLDNGPGIAPEVERRIWDPLYTTTSSGNNPLGSGMGLGLPLVRKVVQARKGTIELVPPPEGFSTCFRVELPLE